jgi:hypothetical protein
MQARDGTTSVVGEISVSFRLPEYCGIDITEVDQVRRSFIALWSLKSISFNYLVICYMIFTQ